MIKNFMVNVLSKYWQQPCLGGFRLAAQCLRYFAYATEQDDPLPVLFCSVGYPLVAPSEH